MQAKSQVELSRRAGAVSLTRTILSLSSKERLAFASALTSAASFSTLAKKWQDLILAAEAEAGIR